MTRDELNELHALAASISDERRGWRAHRRERVENHARARAEAERLAPGKRRRRHRIIASVVVGVIALTGAILVATHLPGSPAPKPKRSVVTVRHLPSPVRAGQGAGLELAREGLPPNVFACQGFYDSQRLGQVPGQQGAAWQAGYLKACLSTS